MDLPLDHFHEKIKILNFKKWPFFQKIHFSKNKFSKNFFFLTTINMVQRGAHMYPPGQRLCYFDSTQRRHQNDALFDTFRQIWAPLRYTLFLNFLFKSKEGDKNGGEPDSREAIYHFCLIGPLNLR